MAIGWSEIQLRRLRELDAGPAEQQAAFDTPVERDREFQRLEHRLARARRDELQEFQQSIRVPRLCRLEAALADALVRGGFSRVVTPTLMSRALLERMSVTRDHPLSEQIFWLDEKRCLRPMLAPHLYHLLVDLLRVWEHPVRIFEIGSCFRRDTQGAQHAAEFTMLNLVEAGLPAADCRRRLAELAALVMEAAGVGGYRLAAERSAVYGETVDVVVPWGEGWLEVGSAALGPHALDRAWKVADPWVGIGFGLERLVMAGASALARPSAAMPSPLAGTCGMARADTGPSMAGASALPPSMARADTGPSMAGARGDSLGRWGRSLVYLDGRRLNL